MTNLDDYIKSLTKNKNKPLLILINSRNYIRYRKYMVIGDEFVPRAYWHGIDVQIIEVYGVLIVRKYNSIHLKDREIE